MNENTNKFVQEPKEETMQERIIKNLARAILGGIAVTVTLESIMLGKKKK